MRKKIDINDLYFGVVIFQMSYSNTSDRKLVVYNLFQYPKIKWAVARYLTMTKKERESLLTDPIHFIFGEVWSRCEWEFIVSAWPSDGNDGIKVDTYRMYVEPNAYLLMEMVNSVSKKSAKRYLAEEQKDRRG